MNLLTFDLLQRERKIKSGAIAPLVDGYGPLINNCYDAFHSHSVPSPLGQNSRFQPPAYYDTKLQEFEQNLINIRSVTETDIIRSSGMNMLLSK